MTVFQELLNEPCKGSITLCIADNCDTFPTVSVHLESPSIGAGEAAGCFDHDVASVRLLTEDCRVPYTSVPELLRNDHQSVFAIICHCTFWYRHTFGLILSRLKSFAIWIEVDYCAKVVEYLQHSLVGDGLDEVCL